MAPPNRRTGRRRPTRPPADRDPLPHLEARGRFHLYKFQQRVGTETFATRRVGGTLRVGVDFSFTDRGEAVRLRAAFHGERDLTPRSFQAVGRNARRTDLRARVRVGARTVKYQLGESSGEADRPDRFFTLAGYAPVTLQMLLLRYWRTHGCPPELATFPLRPVRIRRRGTNRVRHRGTRELVDRYLVEGLIWGREWVWLDRAGRLVALVSTDAEMDRFEAVRAGYEAALPQFIGWAGADGMEALRQFADEVTGERPAVLAFRNGRLVDGTGAPPVEDATVVIRGNQVVAAGPSSGVTVPRGARTVDAGGCTILPGLWDMHAHFQQVEWGSIYLAAGVTTVRDCGNEFEFLTSVRDAIAAGRGLGPRILAAGVVDGVGPYAVGTARVVTAKDAERWVERYHAAGFQQIKVYSSMKLEAVRAVARAAHRRGMTVTGHVPIGLNALEVVGAGQDQVNHITMVVGALLADPPGPTEAKRFQAAVADLDLHSPAARSAIDFLRAHGTVVDPTLALVELYTVSSEKPVDGFEPGAAKAPPEFAGRLRHAPPASDDTRRIDRFFRKCVEVVGALHAAGIPIVAGTDQAVPGHSLHRELELYVEAGLSPMEAIRAATSVPARAMGRADELGSVEPGKRADLVLVRGNPLASIRDLRNVEAVVAAGVLYRPADLWRSVGFQP